MNFGNGETTASGGQHTTHENAYRQSIEEHRAISAAALAPFLRSPE
jgi:hypothetical protein